MLPTSHIDVVHNISPTVYKIIYRGYMMWITCTYSVNNHVTHTIYRSCPQHITHGIYILSPTVCYPHHTSMLFTTYYPRYKIIYRGYMMWITCIYSVDNHVTHIICRCCPQHIIHGIYTLSPTVCYPHHMSMLSTTYYSRYIKSYTVGI